jgi:phosphoglycolate phosphatase-like HAD superfamily hydrolase
VRETLQALQPQADVVVVSATPTEALAREWEEHEIARYARVIAGQEMGGKKQHLALATKGKYAPDHVLMIGDAPGDRDAAAANNARFFPINPGHEDQSWERLYREGLARFTAGTFAGAYEASLIAEFETLLPSTPPWKK